MAEALDAMEQSVTSWEADFLSSILDRLRIELRTLTPSQAQKLEEIYERYLGDGVKRPGTDDEDVDEDDFV